MTYKKFNLYEGVKISEKILSVIIILGLAALAVVIIVFAKPNDSGEKFDDEIKVLAENIPSPSPIKVGNTQNMIK